MRQKNKIKLAILGVIVSLMMIAYYILANTGTVDFLRDSAALKQWILHLGIAGPFLIIALMALAIIMSPIPSAPIALAAGALYGHTEGTVYVLIGAELGAIIAFYIARLLGVDVLQKWFGGRFASNMPGSQNTLMGIVFISRLLPFVSFDIVSYAAGLTSLSFLRFAIATLVGITPTSFLLTHFGSEMASSETEKIAWAILAIGLLSFILAAIKMYRNKTSPSNKENKE